jgi:hypothetical protein
MNNSGDYPGLISECMSLVAMMGICQMARDIIAFDVEKRLGRKLTDWEFRYLLREQKRKAEADAREKRIRRLEQEFVDRRVIHDFVWNTIS